MPNNGWLSWRNYMWQTILLSQDLFSVGTRTCERQKGGNPLFLVNAVSESVARTLSDLVQGTTLVVVGANTFPKAGNHPFVMVPKVFPTADANVAKDSSGLSLGTTLVMLVSKTFTAAETILF